MTADSIALPRARARRRRWRPRRDRLWAATFCVLSLAYLLVSVLYLAKGVVFPGLFGIALWGFIYGRQAHPLLMLTLRSERELPIRGRDWAMVLALGGWLVLNLAIFGV